MSDNWLRLVPVDPGTRPTVAAADLALEILKAAFPQAAALNARYEDRVVFFDAGSNTTSVACSACGANAANWWSDAMTDASMTGFRKLTVTTPCCTMRISLNELSYDWPAAFGCFSLEVFNPGLPTLVEPIRDHIEDVLSTKLTLVWQHL